MSAFRAAPCWETARRTEIHWRRRSDASARVAAEADPAAVGADPEETTVTEGRETATPTVATEGRKIVTPATGESREIVTPVTAESREIVTPAVATESREIVTPAVATESREIVTPVTAGRATARAARADRAAAAETGATVVDDETPNSVQSIG